MGKRLGLEGKSYCVLDNAEEIKEQGSIISECDVYVVAEIIDPSTGLVLEEKMCRKTEVLNWRLFPDDEAMKTGSVNHRYRDRGD